MSGTMVCSTCAVRAEAMTFCRWQAADIGMNLRPTSVVYLCARCCPHCSDPRHSLAPSRSSEVHPWSVTKQAGES